MGNKKYLFIGGFIILIIVFISIMLITNNDIVLKNKEIEIRINDTIKIEYENKKNRNVTWTSDNSNVAIIDEEGYIVGIDAGKTNIIGTYYVGNKKKEVFCQINVYQGNKDIVLKNISVPDGEIIMPVNDSYDIPITIIPKNAYLYDKTFKIADESIVEIENGKVISKKVGKTTMEMIINNEIVKNININVVNEDILSRMGKLIENASLEKDEMTIKVGERKEVFYKIEPRDAYIYRFKLESSNSDIVDVDDKYIIGKKEGNAKVSVQINNYRFELNVSVKTRIEKIVFDYYPKNVIKTGEKITIKARAYPNEKEELLYSSSDPNVIEIENNSIIGKNNGTAVISVHDNSKTIEEKITITVYPRVGVFNDTNVFWQYKSLNSKVPTKADVSFFQKLVSDGKGSLNNGNYVFTKDNITYNYNISKSLLSAGGKSGLVRIYYPLNTDLSTLNTFNFMGGDGERDFNSLFGEIDKNPSLIQSGGIIILMCDSNNLNVDYSGDIAIYATKFVMAITNQQNGVKNSIGGYSTGGTKIMLAANKFDYDKYIIFNSYYNWPTSANGAMNKDVIFYSPKGDHLSPQRDSTLSMMTKVNYSNVTIVTNDNEFISKYVNKYLVINPGSTMDNGHGFNNIIKSGLFAYACD